jgi:putative AdoMet-dependent methyltransferase
MDSPVSYPPADFDDWAETYDASVISDRFPFSGYSRVLECIVTLAAPQPGMRVLDLGTGTGCLALPFARAGCELWCTDFSQPMLEKARKKLPGAYFCRHDLRTALPGDFTGPFDRIVSAYVFHHFELAEKVRILESLQPYLGVDGRMLIGDIAFPDRAALERMKKDCGEDWEEEYYWMAEEALPALTAAGFHPRYEQISACAGIFMLNLPEGTTQAVKPSFG